jgi:hypothetical protein
MHVKEIVMPIAATTHPRSVGLARPRPSVLATAWSRFVAYVELAVDVIPEAREAERDAHRRTPFIDW